MRSRSPAPFSGIRHPLIALPIALATAILLAASLVSTPIGATSPGYSFRVVAKLGDPAPGGGEHEGDFEPQDINASGTVVFASDLENQNGFAGEGVFISRRGVNSQIVREGLPAPGTSTTFGGFGILQPGGLNDAGDFAFGFSLLPSAVPLRVNTGVWRYSAATRAVTKVLAPGDAAPGGTTFQGGNFHTDLNNRGEIVTAGIIDTPFGHCGTPANCSGLGRGVYKFDRRNTAIKIAAPGDPAPGVSGTFDDAWDPNINDRGDVVFGGHVAGETCVNPFGQPLGCFESLYLYRDSTGRLSSLVHQGDVAPGGETFDIVFNGRPNNVGDVSFIGGGLDLSFGVYLYTHQGSIAIVAKPGDPLPGGERWPTPLSLRVRMASTAPATSHLLLSTLRMGMATLCRIAVFISTTPARSAR